MRRLTRRARLRLPRWLSLVPLLLAGCAGQTPDQQKATAGTIAYGLMCVVDATGRIMATAPANASTSQQALAAAAALGGTLVTDPSCPAAVAKGLAAIPQ